MEQDSGEDEVEELRNDARIDWKVYDMPTPLVQEYISMAKLYYDNEAWRVCADALELLKQKHMDEGEDEVDELRRRVEELEAKVVMLQAQVDHGGESGSPGEPGGGDGESPTFGSMRDNSSDEDMDVSKAVKGLKSLNQD